MREKKTKRRQLSLVQNPSHKKSKIKIKTRSPTSAAVSFLIEKMKKKKDKIRKRKVFPSFVNDSQWHCAESFHSNWNRRRMNERERERERERWAPLLARRRVQTIGTRPTFGFRIFLFYFIFCFFFCCFFLFLFGIFFWRTWDGRGTVPPVRSGRHGNLKNKNEENHINPSHRV